MVDVVAWPPVGLTGWEVARLDRPSISRGILTNRRRVTVADQRRMGGAAIVAGIGPDEAGAGYVFELIEQIGAGAGLVRVEMCDALWHLSAAGLDLQSAILNWTSGGTTLNWTVGGTTLIWGQGGAGLSGARTTDAAGYPAVTVTGLPPSRIVARPSQKVTVTDGTSTETARVLTVARSNASGVATIRLTSAFTIDGQISIGGKTSHVFEILDMPRALQMAGENWAYRFEFAEVFEAETDGFTEVDPWA